MNETYISYLDKQRDLLGFRDLAPSTLKSYISYLMQFLEWITENFPEQKLEDITFAQVRTYISYLSEVRRIGNRTVNVHIAQLHHFWLYVLHKEWSRYEVPLKRFNKYLPKVPTRSEVNRLIDSIQNPKHKAEIALLYSSGLRVSELCGLKCHDISKTESFVYVDASKNRCDRRTVLSSRALDILTAYVTGLDPRLQKEDWLFPGRKAGTHISTQSVYNVLTKHLELIGLSDKGYSCHSLRHAFALHLYQSGTDIVTIKYLLGHKSLSSTEIYISLGIGSEKGVKSPYDLS